MRSFVVLLVGILLGAGLLGYGYIRLQEAQTQEFITTTQSTIVTQLHSLSRLTTAQMTVSKIIEGQKDFSDLIPWMWWDDAIRKAFFDDALLMTVEAKVNAGVDLIKVATGGINVVKNATGWYVIDLLLPKAEIFDVYLTDKTKPFERKLGILSKGNQELETKMRNDAVTAVKQEAIDSKILDTAQNNADVAMKEFLSKLWMQVRSVRFE